MGATNDTSADTSLPESFAAFASPRLEWTDHAIDRWDERMPADAVAPETAFKRSTRLPPKALPLFDTGPRGAPQEVYVYAGGERERYLAAFIVADDAIVTVYRARDMDDRPRRAYVWAAAAEGDRS